MFILNYLGSIHSDQITLSKLLLKIASWKIAYMLFANAYRCPLQIRPPPLLLMKIDAPVCNITLDLNKFN